MMMNGGAYQQQALGVNGVVCPKPRRIGVLNPSVPDHFRPSRCIGSIQQNEGYDSGAELLEMILAKPSNHAAFSPPFFAGSPPSRASNPVIQDAIFGNGKPSPLSPAGEASPSRKNSVKCARVTHAHKTPAARVVGFNCRGISGVA